MGKSISKETSTAFAQNVQAHPYFHTLQSSVLKNGIKASVENLNAKIAMQPVFSNEIKTGGVTNQERSGRCWMFAALNTFRHTISNDLNAPDFELSQNHTNFWDKFEKANYFFESIIRTADRDIDDRLVAWLLETPQQDGGQWDMLVSLIQKYGVVPKTAMPETFQSSQSADLNGLLNSRLRKGAASLRAALQENATNEEVAVLKNSLLEEIYRILVYSLGEPPRTFDFEYRDKDGNFHQELGLTPQSFYDTYIGIDLSDYVPLINAPTADKPFGKTYTVDFLGNVIEGQAIKYLNVEIETLKAAAAKQIEAGESVWFGCDVGKFSERSQGVMDTAIYDYQALFDLQPELTKTERLDYKDSLLTHAMVLTGFNRKNDTIDRWKVENSWGEKVGKKGYFVMSDAWMDAYTFQVVVHKKYLPEDLQTAFEQDPTVLKPWDPMGSLALMRG